MIKVRLRNAIDRDEEDFVRCYIDAYWGLEAYAYSSKRDVKNYFKWLMKRDREGIFTVDIIIKTQSFDSSVEKCVAFLACDSNWFSKYENEVVCEIHEIFVRREWRGIGIGSLLINKAVDYAVKKNRSKIELWVGERNYEAIKFYRKFKFVDKEKNGCWIRMVKYIRFPNVR